MPTPPHILLVEDDAYLLTILAYLVAQTCPGATIVETAESMRDLGMLG